jgi:hypothetical protein
MHSRHGFARGVATKPRTCFVFGVRQASLDHRWPLTRSFAERIVVEVKIGIQSAPRELVVDTETAAEDVERALTAALADGGVFSLPDEKGGKILIPADKIAYLELGSSEPRRIGFGNL